MVNTELNTRTHTWTAAELRCLPSEQRDAILALAAERAEVDYSFDHDLTDFEAFGEKDLHGHSSDTKSR